MRLKNKNTLIAVRLDDRTARLLKIATKAERRTKSSYVLEGLEQVLAPYARKEKAA